MSISPIELMLVLIAGIVAGGLWLYNTRAGWWAAGVVVCFAIAALVTPADPLSMLVVGIPYSVGYSCLYWTGWFSGNQTHE